MCLKPALFWPRPSPTYCGKYRMSLKEKAETFILNCFACAFLSWLAMDSKIGKKVL